MIRVSRLWFILIFTACLCGVGCRLRRPETTPSRMIEPQLLEPQPSEPASQVTKAPNATPVRLLDTQSRAHIGRRLLRQQPDGELTEDPVWRWSSAPDRYLDTALHFAVASSRDMRLVDSGSAPALGATLLVWDLESGGTRLVGAAEFQITGTDRVVDTQVVRSSEPVSAELPGDLAAAAGRLLRHLASEGLRAAQANDKQARDHDRIRTEIGLPRDAAAGPKIPPAYPTNLSNVAVSRIHRAISKLCDLISNFGRHEETRTPDLYRVKDTINNIATTYMVAGDRQVPARTCKTRGSLVKSLG